jgi:hypothetical protein
MRVVAVGVENEGQRAATRLLDVLRVLQGLFAAKAGVTRCLLGLDDSRGTPVQQQRVVDELMPGVGTWSFAAARGGGAGHVNVQLLADLCGVVHVPPGQAQPFVDQSPAGLSLVHGAAEA